MEGSKQPTDDPKDYPKLEKALSPYRWLILTLGCLMMIGSYYCFDIPAALKTQIDDFMGDPSDYEFKFGLLYTLYAAPNVILPFFGGYLVDRIGVRSCLLIFSTLIAVGQLIVCIGLSIKSWPVLFLGRLVFGFGGESFTVANSALLADWFKGKELAFAFGVNLSISKLGSVVNNVLSPALTVQFGVLFALWFGEILCAACVGVVLITLPIDRAIEKKISLQGEGYILISTVENKELSMNSVLADDHHQQLLSRGKNGDTSPDQPNRLHSNTFYNAISDPVSGTDPNSPAAASINFSDVLSLPHIFWILVILCASVYGAVLPFNNISSSLLLERDYFQIPPSSCHLNITNQCESSSTDSSFQNPSIDCPASRWFQPPLPMDLYLDGSYYSGQLTQSDVDCSDDIWAKDCTKPFCDRLTDAESQSSVIMSIPYLISAVLSPPLGIFIDKFGYRAIVATLAPMTLIIVHFVMAYTTVSPIGPLVGQGLAYTGFVSVLWPAVPLVVEERVTGLAFGIVTSMQNLACAVIPLLVATIYDDSGGSYIPNVEILLASLGILGTVVGLYLNYVDYMNGSVLNSPTKEIASSQMDYQEESTAEGSICVRQRVEGQDDVTPIG